jgi:hypothetical protein
LASADEKMLKCIGAKNRVDSEMKENQPTKLKLLQSRARFSIAQKREKNANDDFRSNICAISNLISNN